VLGVLRVYFKVEFSSKREFIYLMFFIDFFYFLVGPPVGLRVIPALRLPRSFGKNKPRKPPQGVCHPRSGSAA
jgi:hypothetical protein